MILHKLKEGYQYGTDTMLMQEDPMVINYIHISAVLLTIILAIKYYSDVAILIVAMLLYHLILFFVLGIFRANVPQEKMETYSYMFLTLEMIVWFALIRMKLSIWTFYMAFAYLMPYCCEKLLDKCLDIAYEVDGIAFFVAMACVYLIIWSGCIAFILMGVLMQLSLCFLILYALLIPVMIWFEFECGDLYAIAFNLLV